MPTFADTLSLLADRGLTVQRTAGDKLRLVGDVDLNADVAEQVRQYRDEFLRLLPDPTAKIAEQWERVVHDCNAMTPTTWFPSAADWRRLDEIAERFQNAKAAGDAGAATDACNQYGDELQRQLLIDDAYRWASEMECQRCGFGRTDEQLICGPCRDHLKHKRDEEVAALP